ncbi:uncharacterized protein [Palaemon carinicauda]|uniref:uncharacterized protein n=1 Tax=Palaemon carinicauda TaxID=392227 RepID=UPI0035B63E61
MDDVKNKIKRLSKSKAPGPDDIHPREIIELKEEITPLLQNVRKTANERKAPQGWRLHNVLTFFKKEPKEESGNYIPVSGDSQENFNTDRLSTNFTGYKALGNVLPVLKFELHAG